jgi:hypothetical protein
LSCAKVCGQTCGCAPQKVGWLYTFEFPSVSYEGPYWTKGFFWVQIAKFVEFSRDFIFFPSKSLEISIRVRDLDHSRDCSGSRGISTVLKISSNLQSFPILFLQICFLRSRDHGTELDDLLMLCSANIRDPGTILNAFTSLRHVQFTDRCSSITI